jgi:cell division septation protein DedD
MSNEEFHEIQLNGKQLVFLFMAATVVAVVIFLCGVMVGRGVPTRAAAPIDAPQQAAIDPTAPLGVPAADLGGPATQGLAADNGPITAQETLTYPTLLEDRNPPVETLAPSPVPPPAPTPPVIARAEAAKPAPKPEPPKPASAAPRAVTAAPQPAPVPAPVPAALPAPQPAAAALAEPRGNGFVVQVAAVRKRAEADTIARRLSGKGYPAFVTTAGANFRVRVGKFDDRRQAELTAGRLEREEQFKPWITR